MRSWKPAAAADEFDLTRLRRPKSTQVDFPESTPRSAGDTLGARGGVEEAAKVRVRCAWAKFKEFSPILTAQGALYHLKGNIYRACVQSVFTYGTETWMMSGEDGANDGEMDV